jgi:hypothetical protein
MISYNLFITNCEFALRLLVILCKSLQLLDRLALRDRESKFGIAFCVLVTRLLSSALWIIN